MNKFAIAIVLAFALSACAGNNATTLTVAKELRNLRKLAGAGEISNAEYNARKDKLLESGN